MSKNNRYRTIRGLKLNWRVQLAGIIMLAAYLPGCSKPDQGPQQNDQAQDVPAAAAAPVENASANQASSLPSSDPNRRAYFGDLHVHTKFSFDAYLFGTRRTPDDAYRFAKGDAIRHASGFEMQLKKPLDFQSVTDHDIYLGVMPAMADPESPFSKHKLADAVTNVTDAPSANQAFAAVLAHVRRIRQTPGAEDELSDSGVARAAWAEIIAAAQQHNDPGKFTTFIGYEYTRAGDEMQNLHRNVIFKGSDVPIEPFNALNTQPEELWRWLDEQRELGREGLAIPHNSNGSDGEMFARQDSYGKDFDANYAELRMRNEPLVENTQVKGTSDTHPLLSPNDEWADFEIMPLRVASTLPSRAPGSYVREAYLNGLEMAATQGFNPYRFGVIGSSDTHNAAGSFDEDNYWSKTGVRDIQPVDRGSVPLAEPGPEGEQYASPPSRFWGGSGLAGVWAESNTRDAIYAAFRRKETFSTSGPHIKVRFFAGYDLQQDLLFASDNIAQLYRAAVPMGGELVRNKDQTPHFFAWATRDADSGNLQRLQIIKGWYADGEKREQVYDVSCSDGGVIDPSTQRCPDNGAGVDLNSCTPTPNKGAAELAALWRDPDFDPTQRAFYYLRVLENPICRWSTWDALRAGVAPRPDLPATIQDRAWSSPIWYLP